MLETLRFVVTRYSAYLLLFFGFSTLAISCVPDKKSEAEMIQGLWILEQATRNGKMTNSLDGMYMKFMGGKSFDSNILGDTSSFLAQVENGKISVDHDLIKIFEIGILNDSLMKLTTEINHDEISFVFKR